METQLFSTNHRSIAYFSMEIGLESEIPTYSGGLGVLAGDTIRSFADLNVPAVAVSLLYRKGYFEQTLDETGQQSESEEPWDLSDLVQEHSERVSVFIEGREVHIRAFRYDVQGVRGHNIPVYLLDTDLPENSEQDRKITHHLYGGGHDYRFPQEVVLGIGGAKMLEALGYNEITKYHMNEGHSALLTLELMKRFGGDIEKVKQHCVFTTHTPVDSGHDQFAQDLVKRMIGEEFPPRLLKENLHDGKLNMTLLALNHSGYVNGVAKRHGEVSRGMFPGYDIEAITNGVHVKTWLSRAMAKLFDDYIPGWKCDSFLLRSIMGVPAEKIWDAHQAEKVNLINHVNETTGTGMSPDVLTIGFARRATGYKRADLIFHDIEKLRAIAKQHGGLQIIFAGRAHPHDGTGKDLIKRIYQNIEKLKDDIKIVYLEDYDMNLGKLMTSGVDVWLNTPQCPKEASGTSGMKATINGVLNFSTIDGWWVEGHIEDITGWSIGTESCNVSGDNGPDAESLYQKLEEKILPTFYNNREQWVYMMRHAIALNGSIFNTYRMVQQYTVNAYLQ